MSSKHLEQLAHKYQKLLEDSPEASLAGHPTIKITSDDGPPSLLLESIQGTCSPKDPRDISIATAVWGDVDEKTGKRPKGHGKTPAATSSPISPSPSPLVGKRHYSAREILADLDKRADEEKARFEYIFVRREGVGMEALSHKELKRKQEEEKGEFNPRRLRAIRERDESQEYSVIWSAH
jgi:hypothetical protein